MHVLLEVNLGSVLRTRTLSNCMCKYERGLKGDEIALEQFVHGWKEIMKIKQMKKKK